MGSKGINVGAVAAAVAFALSVFCLGLFVWISFGGNIPFGAKGYRVNVRLGAEASNLFPNADVRISGVSVGNVAEVKTSQGRVDATVELEERYVPLREGARAVLRSKTLLGEAYIELTPGSKATRPIPEGGRVTTSRVLAAQNVDGALSLFDAKGRRDLRTFLEGLADATDERGPDLNAALGSAPLAVQDLRDLVTVLDRQRKDVRGLIGDTARTLQTVGDRSQDVQELARAGSQVLRTSAERDRQLTATVRELPGLLRSVRSFSRETEALSNDVAPAVRRLRPVAPLLEPGLRAGRLLAPDLKRTFRALDATITASRAGVPALSDLLRNAAPLLRVLDPAGRELVPVLRTLEDFREDAIAAIANTGAATNAAFTRDDGTRKHYLRVLLVINNEIGYGQTRRDGTHRENGYLPPGGLRALLGGGPIRAIDCRDASNDTRNLQLGSGPPPCLQQRPFSIAGGPAGRYPRVVRDGSRP